MLHSRDIPAVAWSILEQVGDGVLDSRQGSVMVSALRVLIAVGESAPGDEEALREVELRGRLMHGLPPRDGAEWAFAEERFSSDAVAEIQRWARSLEGDGFDRIDPGGLGDE